VFITLLGKRYSLKIEALGRYKQNGEQMWGACSQPTDKNKAIWIDKRLKGEHELEILLHEMMHACDWQKDEEFIGRSAKDIARALWRIGFRKTQDEVKT